MTTRKVEFRIYCPGLGYWDGYNGENHEWISDRSKAWVTHTPQIAEERERWVKEKHPNARLV